MVRLILVLVALGLFIAALAGANLFGLSAVDLLSVGSISLAIAMLVGGDALVIRK